MNETVLMVILTGVMAFFMIFGLIGASKKKKRESENK